MTQTSEKWYNRILTPQTFLYAMGAIVATVIFWYRTQEGWVKVKEVEGVVNRQWQLQREMNDKTNARIEAIERQLEYDKGYNDALNLKTK